MKRHLSLGLFAAVALTACGDYSDGERVGTVQKFSIKGVFFKTYEGELALSGFKMRGNNGNVFEFTVEDKIVADQIQHAMETQKTVHLTYHQETICAPWRAESDCYFITGVKEES